MKVVTHLVAAEAVTKTACFESYIDGVRDDEVPYHIDGTVTFSSERSLTYSLDFEMRTTAHLNKAQRDVLKALTIQNLTAMNSEFIAYGSLPASCKKVAEVENTVEMCMSISEVNNACNAAPIQEAFINGHFVAIYELSDDGVESAYPKKDGYVIFSLDAECADIDSVGYHIESHPFKEVRYVYGDWGEAKQAYRELLCTVIAGEDITKDIVKSEYLLNV